MEKFVFSNKFSKCKNNISQTFYNKECFQAYKLFPPNCVKFKRLKYMFKFIFVASIIFI